MEKRQVEIKTLKPGSFCLIEGVPCKVDALQTSKPGKHGGAKARLVASGIFNSQKMTIVKPADTKIDVPIIEKKNMQAIAFVGNHVQLMNLEDYSMIEILMPDDLKGEIHEGDEVLVWKFGPHIMIKGKK
ncbi:MAG: translation initiation factor IF-5A [Candidatus Aenigmarchaeota archaeon]|nr:translation initiation factor IF-5A [Candidatus Aenigmarchaeota archaeon]